MTVPWPYANTLLASREQRHAEVPCWGDSLSQPLPDGDGDPEQNLGALEEHRVPDLQHGGRRQAGGEHGEEPLHREHVGQRRLVAAWEERRGESSVHKHGHVVFMHTCDVCMM